MGLLLDLLPVEQAVIPVKPPGGDGQATHAGGWEIVSPSRLNDFYVGAVSGLSTSLGYVKSDLVDIPYLRRQDEEDLLLLLAS